MAKKKKVDIPPDGGFYKSRDGKTVLARRDGKEVVVTESKRPDKLIKDLKDRYLEESKNGRPLSR